MFCKNLHFPVMVLTWAWLHTEALRNRGYLHPDAHGGCNWSAFLSQCGHQGADSGTQVIPSCRPKLTLVWSWHSSCHPCFSKSLHKGHQHGSWTSDKGGLILVKDWLWFSRGKPRPIGWPSHGIPTSNIQKHPWTMAPWSRFATGGSQPESFQSQRQDVWKETWWIYQ